MTTDEYVPSDDDMRESYVHGETCDREGGVWDTEVPGAQESFARWLAAHDTRVRRDAAREALAGMASAHTGAFMEEDRPTYRHEHNIAAQAADNYMRAHYPEETP